MSKQDGGMTATDRARELLELRRKANQWHWWWSGFTIRTDDGPLGGEDNAKFTCYAANHVEEVCEALLAAEAKVAALEKVVAKWEGVKNATREYWECAVCGDRYHGDDREAPFHTDENNGDPICNICG